MVVEEAHQIHICTALVLLFSAEVSLLCLVSQQLKQGAAELVFRSLLVQLGLAVLSVDLVSPSFLGSVHST